MENKVAKKNKNLVPIIKSSYRKITPDTCGDTIYNIIDDNITRDVLKLSDNLLKIGDKEEVVKIVNDEIAKAEMEKYKSESGTKDITKSETEIKYENKTEIVNKEETENKSVHTIGTVKIKTNFHIYIFTGASPYGDDNDDDDDDDDDDAEKKMKQDKKQEFEYISDNISKQDLKYSQSATTFKLKTNEPEFKDHNIDATAKFSEKDLTENTHENTAEDSIESDYVVINKFEL